MAGRHEGSRHGSLDRLHPLIELALLECHLAQARTRLEYLLLAGGLEILRDRHLERGFVLRHKAAHAVELFNPSSMAPRHAGCEVAFLSVEQILEQIHGADPHGGLPSSCTAPGTGATQGRRRPTNNSMTGWNHSLASMPPAFTTIISSAASDSVVSGDPHAGNVGAQHGSRWN
jgi:hypothetical protein